MRKLYGGLKMSWLTVILFAVAAGVYTGIILTIPFLKDTSFQDIGIFYEWWVIFAVIVVVNCQKGTEAMLKCFVFFLISQPLVFGTEILLGCLSPESAWGYYRHIWLPATFLTLPGGFIAWFCKRQDPWGAVVLGLGNTILAALAVSYFGKAAASFPRHLLSGLVCVAAAFVMTFFIQREQKNRLIALLLPVGLTAVIAVAASLTGRVFF